MHHLFGAATHLAERPVGSQLLQPVDLRLEQRLGGEMVLHARPKQQRNSASSQLAAHEALKKEWHVDLWFQGLRTSAVSVRKQRFGSPWSIVVYAVPAETQGNGGVLAQRQSKTRQRHLAVP